VTAPAPARFHVQQKITPFQNAYRVLSDVDGLTRTCRWGWRDSFVLEVARDTVDPRLAIALAICLDALQGR
jgi:uncharacterized protein YxjI